MSVPKGDRGASDAEFLVESRKLKILTVQKCSKLPKRLNHGINDPLIWQANEIKRLIIKANSINPANKGEAADRQRGFKFAVAELYSMSSNIQSRRWIRFISALSLITSNQKGAQHDSARILHHPL